jgi:GNAT superfamily N-acetyltransferase
MKTTPCTIRLATPEDAHQIARVHVVSWHSIYTGIIPRKYIEEMTYDVQRTRWKNILTNPPIGECDFVAEVDGQIVGFASGGPEREAGCGYAGELYAIYLDASVHRQGIGHTLLSSVVDHLIQQQRTSMRIWVLSQNPACGFYERIGGQIVAEKELTIGECRLPGRAYGWDDIRLFAQAGANDS